MKMLHMSVLWLVLGTALTAGAVPVIELPAQPPARRTVQLQEQWRLGDDDEDVLLGVITSALLNEAGQVLLVDRQLSHVLVIGPDGELVTILGREGEGPGELNQPHTMVRLDDGAVGVVQGFPGRIIGLNADGTPAGDITFGGDEDEEGGFSFVMECGRTADSFVARTGRLVFDMNTGKARNTAMLAVYDRRGTRTAVIAEHARDNDMTRQVFDEAAEFSELNQWAVSPDGLIYTCPVRDAFILTVRDLQGHTLYSLQRPFTPRHRTQADKDEAGNGINIVMNGQKVAVQNKALDTDPAINDLAVAEDGRIFVTNCFNYRKLLPIGTAGRYDVISRDGEYQEELTLTVPDFDGTEDVLLFMDGKHFLVIRNFDSASAAMDNPGAGEETEEEEAAPLAVIFLALP